MNFIEPIGFVLSITGNIFLIYKKWQGFLIWLLANTLWIIFNLHNSHYWQAGLFIFYNVMCLWGIYEWKWRKK